MQSLVPLFFYFLASVYASHDSLLHNEVAPCQCSFDLVSEQCATFTAPIDTDMSDMQLSEQLDTEPRHQPLTLDLSMYHTFRDALKGSEDAEFDVTLELYLEAAGFDAMWDRFTNDVHCALETRLEEALILA